VTAGGLLQSSWQNELPNVNRADSGPDMPETLYDLGRALSPTDPKGAEQAFTRVPDLEKDTSLASQAYLALAAVHRKLGKPEQAAYDMQEFRRIQALTVPASTPTQ
jgi:hypothetical protein